jgi:hypothetical protein
MANQSQPQSQPQSGQAQQQTGQQLEQAVEQHAQAHGISLPTGGKWGALIFEILKVLVNAGVIPSGESSAAPAGQPPPRTP